MPRFEVGDLVIAQDRLYRAGGGTPTVSGRYSVRENRAWSIAVYHGGMAPSPGRAHELAEELSALADRRGIRVAVAESLTSGRLAAALGAAGNSGAWFRGAVVAYSREVKYHVLGVPEGPVVCAEAAVAMAEGVRTLFEANLAVGVTGAGGPDSQDGAEPGSVWFAVATGTATATHHRTFAGDPLEVLDQTVAYALQLLLGAARKGIR